MADLRVAAHAGRSRQRQRGCRRWQRRRGPKRMAVLGEILLRFGLRRIDGAHGPPCTRIGVADPDIAAVTHGRHVPYGLTFSTSSAQRNPRRCPIGFRSNRNCGRAYPRIRPPRSAARPSLNNPRGSAPRRRRETGRERAPDHLSPGPLDRSSVGQGRFIPIASISRSDALSSAMICIARNLPMTPARSVSLLMSDRIRGSPAIMPAADRGELPRSAGR